MFIFGRSSFSYTPHEIKTIILGKMKKMERSICPQRQLTGVFTMLTYFGRDVIEFAPCRLLQKQLVYRSSNRHGVNTLNVPHSFAQRLPAAGGCGAASPTVGASDSPLNTRDTGRASLRFISERGMGVAKIHFVRRFTAHPIKQSQILVMSRNRINVIEA